MLIVETLHRTGHLDPAALFALPQEWQMMHLAHTRSWLIGRYDPQPASQRTRRAPANPAAVAAAAAEMRKGARQQDIDGARQLLLRPGLPEHLYRAARATLKRAGVSP